MRIKLHGVIVDAETKKYDLMWSGDSDLVTFKDLDEALAAKPKDDKQILLDINCPGGSCVEGFAIYDKLRSLEGHTITAEIIGECSSMATIVLMAASVRKAHANARICIHKPRYEHMFMEQMTDQDALRMYTALHDETERLKKIYLDRTSFTDDELESLMDEDRYMTAEEALRYGVITEIIQPMTASKTNHITAMKKTELKAWQKKAMCAIGLAHLVAELEKEEVIAMTLNTEDGSTIEVEREEGEPQVGDAATPDGEHKMADGTTIVIADGVITEIKPAEEQVEEEESDETAEAIKAMKEEIDALTAENEDLKKQLSACKANEKSAQDIETLQLVSNAGGIEWLKSLKSEHKPAGRTAPQSTEKMSSLSERLAAKKEELKNKNKKQK